MSVVEEPVAEWPTPAQVVRPNGKTYRARKVRMCVWDNGGYHNDDKGVVVLGTHDVEQATAVAHEGVRYWFDHELIATKPEVGWFRLGYHFGEQSWMRDQIKGAAGVMFTADYPPDAP